MSDGSGQEEEGEFETIPVAPPPSEKPHVSTMEGMIWNANQVLTLALQQQSAGAGIPTELLCNAKETQSPPLVGVVLLSMVQAGFGFSWSKGSGILLKRRNDGAWSKPVAVEITSFGWGVCLGACRKDVVLLIPDEETLQSFLRDDSSSLVRVGSQAEVTLPFATGRSFKMDSNMSGRNVGATYSIAFSKGAFVGISLEGAVVKACHAVNQGFFGKAGENPQVVVNDDDDAAVRMPTDKVTVLDQVYSKLRQLVQAARRQVEKEMSAATTELTTTPSKS